MNVVGILAGKVRRRFRRNLKRLKGNPPKIFFCHVPKCAGIAITEKIWEGVFDGHEVSTFSINLNASLRASKMFSIDRMRVREIVLAYNLSIPENHFGAGHVSCSPDLVENFMGEWHFITILRHPIDRWISEYVYNTYKKADWAKNTLPLDEYIESERGRITGISFVRYFSSMPPDYSGRLNDLVDEAVTNLGRFSVIGTLENLTGWCQDFKEYFKENITIPPRNNISPNAGAAHQIRSNPSLVKKIEKLCEPDISIYQRIAEQAAR